ncbi:MAG: aspartyl protease family protein [Flavobacteriaceae bacterium]|uniref:Aspartyl protease family protein n=1 Tax=Flavobacterium kayseriense TaxID=2764714 RepID=A0ABR7J6M8_9FLAO|nr:aspartyl protease family protein [Flavobacterium kayseriense]MBC5841181.1 aspartyl protease family protein [Flavobacterium kayseriense]MBC5847709.1 aspartyl protease family protein [Flavobacterium kayseriense]MBU0939919.1 aspartyl protease family protein [Bacteroidota bacterium]MBX9887572.1 aspartyl protease family protein [Flavobacteriaceae bacterium]
MKKIVLSAFLFICFSSLMAQNGFVFNKEAKRIKIPFQLINNLIFIPLQVNGTELTFMLDSGVQETILFSLEEKDSISLLNTETIELKGLGSKDAVAGLRSTGNQLKVKGMVSEDHMIYVILDESFNLSSKVGIPVNGIIGYPFFRNNLLEINYANKMLVFHRDRTKFRRKLEKKYKSTTITIEGNKPYVQANVTVGSREVPVKLLIDTGHSDALWLFENKSVDIKVPSKNFDDYLGKGFSGDIYGKRALISEFKINDFKFENPIAAFPDSTSLKHVKMVSGRLGSVGGEIFKRFSVVFDYKNGQLFLRKNSDFKAYFNYNKSGIEIRNAGMQWVQETISLKLETKKSDYNTTINDNLVNNFRYNFKLKPIYEIDNVRKNSESAKAGLLAGDIVKSINGKEVQRYSLNEVNSLLKAEKEKWITIEVIRKGRLLKFRFKLLKIL